MSPAPFNPSASDAENVNVFHQNDDVDKSALSHHHTLGVGDTQASPGSHRHTGTDSYQIDYNNLLNLPTSFPADFTSVVKHEVKLGEAIAKGQAVYVSSADGTNMIVSKASNTSEATSSKTMGLLETGGALNAKVNVITEGLLAGLDTSTATVGDAVWLGTSGNLIFWHYGGATSKPVAPAHLVFIGIVTRVNANNGEIFVKVQNGFELEELHSVLLDASASIADNEVLAYDSASSLWKNQTAAEAGLSEVGHTHDDRYYTETETNTLLSGKSDTGHTHTIANITNLQTTLDGKIDAVPIEIGNAIDLNTFTTTGLWTQSSNAEAAAGTNYPIAYAGLLEVATAASGVFIWQRYTTYQVINRAWYRSYYNGTWSAWKEYSTVGHTHAIADVTNLQTALDGKASTTHSHVIADVTGLSTSLADKADLVHSHAIADVTGLQTAIDGKAANSGYTANKVIVTTGAGDITTSSLVDTTELNYLDGVTSNIQTQLNAKAANSGYTASRAIVSDATGNLAVSPLVSSAELDYLDGVTSNIQTQLNGKSATGHTHIISETTGLQTALDGKASSTHTHAIGDVTSLQTTLDAKALNSGYTINRVLVTSGAGDLIVSPTIDTTELGYLNGVTSNIQTQLDSKAAESGYTASRAMVSDATGNLTASSLVSSAELDYLDGVTSNIQTQLNGKSATGHTHIISETTGLQTALDGKAALSHTHTIANVTGLQTALDGKAAVDGYTASRVLVSNSLGAITASTTIDTTELGYLNGVTSGIQSQLDGKDVKDLYRFEISDNLIMSSVGAQTTASIFGTNGVAVEASTAYLVQGVIYFTAGVVGTSATHSLNWGSPSGAATVTRNSWLWDYNSSTTALNLSAAMSGVRRNGTTTFAALNTITMTGTHLFRGEFYGIVEFNAAGNFTPRITVTPTSATVDLTVNAGSYITLTKLGATGTQTYGTWA